MAGKRYDSKHRVLYTGEDERPDGRYRFRTKIKGKTHVIYAQTLAELRQKEKEFEKMVESGTDIDKQNMTVNDFAELYLKAKKQTIQRTTFSVVNEFYNRYIKESIGKKVITSVKKSQVKSYYLSLVEKGLAISTLQRIDGILAPIFEMAVDDDVIIKNPARKVVAEIKKEMHARSTC